MAKRGRPRKNREVPLSEESEKRVKQGLQEAKEGKLERVGLDKECSQENEHSQIVNNLLVEKNNIQISQERKDKLSATLREINKIIPDAVKYANTIEERARLSFGYVCLDKLTGGGIPAGTYTTIWGGKGCAKSTIVLDLIAKAQKCDKQCIYINGERSFDPAWAKSRGVDINNLVIVEVENLEEGLDTIIKLCREKVADLIVLDSIHGLAPHGELYEGKADKEKSVEQDTMALRARKMTQFFEMATSFVAEAKCAVLLVAQSRMDLSGFIKLEHLTGGHALMHFSRLILRVRRGQKTDAPTEKRPTGKITEKGKEEMENIPIGFDLVVHVDKAQIPGCTEGNEIHVLFHFKDGIHE
jgi:RecA/RadA recombinase